MADSASPAGLFLAHLRAGAPEREMAVARVTAVLAGIGLLTVSFLPMPDTARHHLQAYLLFAVIYEAAVVWLIRRGRYSSLLPWVGATLETSLCFMTLLNGADHIPPSWLYASPAFIPWGAVLVFSAIRMKPLLSVAMGALAAGESLAFQAFFVQPGMIGMLDGAGPATGRALMLFGAGCTAALLSRFLLGNAEQAFRAVREQDLMGKYLLHEQLGAGGMAEVFRATYCPEGGFKKPVAVKRVLPALSSDPEFARLFLEEARLCAGLSHPNVVQVTDCGRYQGTFILAMELVDGISLLALLRKLYPEPLPISAATYVAAEIASALEYLHTRIGEDGKPLALVHRDLNPANVLLSRFGEVKVADFGVAHAAIRAPESPDAFYGKVRYAAPEQLRGERLDGRADLFALGLTLYEMLTAKRAVKGEDTQAATSILHADRPVPGEARADVPPALDAIVRRLCERDRAARFPTASDARAALLALGGAAAPYPNGRAELNRVIALVSGEAFRPRASTAEPEPESTRTTDLRGKAASNT